MGEGAPGALRAEPARQAQQHKNGALNATPWTPLPLNTHIVEQVVKPVLLTLLMPPAPMLILILLGAWLIWRHRRGGLAAICLGVIGVWLGTCSGTGQLLATYLIHVPASLSVQQMADLREEVRSKGDVAVLVLGAGVRNFVPEYHNSGLRPLTLERLRYGIWLSRQLDAPLGYTGGIGWNSVARKLPEAIVVSRVAREEFGKPLKWSEGRSRDTRENASLSLPMLKADGVKKVVLVTNDLHMPRALQDFVDVAQGQMEIVPAPVGLVADGLSEPGDWCPSVDGFERVQYAVYEWLGRLAGH